MPELGAADLHTPTPSGQRPTRNGRPFFVALQLLPDGGPLLVALRQGLIEPGDVAVVLAIAQGFEWISRRYWATIPALAAAVGFKESQVMAAADRLLAAELVAYGWDRERPWLGFWRINPQLLSSGRATLQNERLHRTEWAELLDAGSRPDDRSGGTRPRRLRELAREAKAAAKTKPKPKPKTKSRTDRHRVRPEVADRKPSASALRPRT